MRASCHLNRPSNFEIGVEYRMFLLCYFLSAAKICILGPIQAISNVYLFWVKAPFWTSYKSNFEHLKTKKKTMVQFSTSILTFNGLLKWHYLCMNRKKFIKLNFLLECNITSNQLQSCYGGLPTTKSRAIQRGKL